MEIDGSALLDLRRLVLRWATRWGATDDDAEDIAQDVLFRVLRFREGFRGDARVSSWTYRITRNVLLTRVRRSELRSRAEARFGARTDQLADSREGPMLEALEARRLVRAWLRDGTLTPSELRLIAMTARDGMTSVEAAARFGCRPGTIRSRVSRVVGRVRREVGVA